MFIHGHLGRVTFFIFKPYPYKLLFVTRKNTLLTKKNKYL